MLLVSLEKNVKVTADVPIDLLDRGRALIKNFPNDSVCAICNTQIEVQGHHLFPRHLGGPQDGPLISLCSAHHLLVHRLSGKSKTIPEGFTASQIKLIRILVQFIEIAKIQAEDLDPTFIDRKVPLTVPHALLKRLHKRKADEGYSNLQDYILSLLLKDTLEL